MFAFLSHLLPMRSPLSPSHHPSDQAHSNISFQPLSCYVWRVSVVADCPPKTSDSTARRIFSSQQDHLTASPTEMAPSHSGKKCLLPAEPSGIHSNDLKFHACPPTRETRLSVWTGNFCLPPTTDDGAISLCSSVRVNILDIKTLRTPTVTPIHPSHSNLFSTSYSPHRYYFAHLRRRYLPPRYSPTYLHRPYLPHR